MPVSRPVLLHIRMDWGLSRLTQWDKTTSDRTLPKLDASLRSVCVIGFTPTSKRLALMDNQRDSWDLELQSLASGGCLSRKDGALHHS